jgi:hypothetical protein
MPFAPYTELAISMLWNLKPGSHSAQVCDLAQEIHRRFGIAVFKFSIRRAHAAGAPNSAIHAF